MFLLDIGMFMMWVVSAVAACDASHYSFNREEGKASKALKICITAGLIYCIPTIIELLIDIAHLDSYALWSVLALIVWDLSFLLVPVLGAVLMFASEIIIVPIILAVLYSCWCGVFLQVCDTAHVTTKTIPILNVIDTTEIEGSISGGGIIITRISGSVSEETVYRYYYQVENGDIFQGEVPADTTAIRYIEESERPYLEMVTSTECFSYHKETLEHNLGTSHTTYRLYVPEGSIQNIFQFDGN